MISKESAGAREPLGAMTMPRFLRLWRHRLRTRLARHTAYVGWLRVSPRWKGYAVRHNTELVIEGFPRSGNTFAEFALRLAQLGPIRVAHHTHAPGQVLWAAAHGIPSILLIRRPIDAVVSYILREPYLPPRQALSDWIGFYTTLKVEKKHLVLATFEEVTADFGQVVARLNAFYGVRFELPVVTEETTRHIFEQIEALHRLHRRSGVTDEMQVARPSPERGGPGSHLRALLMEAPSRPLLEEADRLYDSYLEDVSLSVPHLRRVPGRAGPGPAAAE